VTRPREAGSTGLSSRLCGAGPAVWTFHVGGYQVLNKWLKDRKGRVLSGEGIRHDCRVAMAPQGTIRLVAETAEIIEAHGGWPGAFVTGVTP